MLTGGDKFYAKRTVTNQNCGISPGDVGYITFLGDGDVSFYLERRRGRGYMEAVCRLPLFGANFAQDWRLAGLSTADLADQGGGTARSMAYLGKQHHARRFPEEFFG